MISLLLLVGVTSAATIFEIKDEEAGIQHVQSGVPGTEVEGEFSFNAPEGDMYALKYTAGEQGFLAEGAHLPLHPADTEEVASARSSFLEAFQAAEAEHAAMEAEDMAVEASRRRRSPVTNPVATAAAVASPAVVSYGVPVNTAGLRYTVPLASSYLYPRLHYTHPATYAVQYPYYTVPVAQPAKAADVADVDAKTVVQAAPVYQPALSLTHPVVRIGYPALQTAVAPAIPSVEAAPESTVQEGDDEAAALAL